LSESPLREAPRCGGQRGPRQAEPGQLICSSCTTRLRRDIEITPTLERWLSHHVAPGTGGGVKVSGSREAPVPVRLEVIDHAAHMRHLLQSWAWLICEHRGLVYPERVTVADLSSWLGRHVEWAAGRPWVSDMCEELAGLRRTTHALAPWQVQVDLLLGRARLAICAPWYRWRGRPTSSVTCGSAAVAPCGRPRNTKAMWPN
jgi:hypothetical protein